MNFTGRIFSPFRRNLIFIFLYFATSLSALQIHIITYTNGVGLTRDVDLLMEELTQLGHDVKYIHFQDMEIKPKADINIFIEHVNEFLLQLADKNYFIPNPEWYISDISLISKFDMILCKTREAEKIFKKLNPNTNFISFSCRDCFDKTVVKDYKTPIHLMGKSSQKGTDALFKVWKDHSVLPTLILIKHEESKHEDLPNLRIVYEYLPDDDLLLLQNHCGMHICPSETEGFGHYIFEALSCGAVVVTTNAPPMNEFIKDLRCLINYNRTSQSKLATNYHVDEIHLAQSLKRLLKLPEKELEKIGKKNRDFYLKNDQFFKSRLKDIFGEVGAGTSESPQI